jgi:medium-chain acyl-[acyl-carrier-protein] hydrolase
MTEEWHDDPSLRRWLPFSARTRPRPSLRLFCFPHAGGGASAFRGWLASPVPGVELHPVQLPGRETRYDEALPASFRPLIPELAEALLPLLDVPFALLGNSMGSLIAYELARHLQRRFMLCPVWLFAAAALPPPEVEHIPKISDSPDQELIRLIQQRYNGIPREIADNPEFRATFLPILRGDLRLLEVYRWDPESALSCPVTVVSGRADSSVDPGVARGWAAVTSGPFEQVRVAGGHLALLDHRDLVLDRLSRLSLQAPAKAVPSGTDG